MCVSCTTQTQEGVKLAAETFCQWTHLRTVNSVQLKVGVWWGMICVLKFYTVEKTVKLY